MSSLELALCASMRYITETVVSRNNRDTVSTQDGLFSRSFGLPLDIVDCGHAITATRLRCGYLYDLRLECCVTLKIDSSCSNKF